jgi:hypothetical protein
LEATYFLLVKSTAGKAPQPANFEAAVNNAAQRTGATISNVWIAQGPYDFIVEVGIDTANTPAIDGVDTSQVAPQHASLALAAALAQNAAVSTETVPVVAASDGTLQKYVGHSCT